MQFDDAALSSLMATTPADEVAAAEWANLCLEERVSAHRQATYEERMDQPAEWGDWRKAHSRYVQQDVRRRDPLSAAFDPSEALRPHLEANQELYRVERIDRLLSNYAGAALGVDQLGRWIANRNAERAASQLHAGDAMPTDAALADLTRFLNRQLADGRPRFVAFAAEFPDLEAQADWPRVICERCGLAHHFAGTTVTLALFRYSVQDVLDAYRDIEPGTAVFAAPTVLDQPMWSVYFSAPSNVGHAVGLAPQPDCAHLAAGAHSCKNRLPARALGGGGHIERASAVSGGHRPTQRHASAVSPAHARQCRLRARLRGIAMAPREDGQPSHPYTVWAEALLSNSREAMSDILEGGGSRGALQHAEPADYLADLLAQPAISTLRDELVVAIDRALIEWMEERADWPPARVARFGTRAYVAQFSDALAAVARLPLTSSPGHLLDNVGMWDDRFRSMRWPNDIDLLRQFDLALAQHQPDDRLTSRWFASCEEAAWAGPYWRDGLGTALVGLRKIPDPTTTQPERLVATALARFAALSSQRRTDSPELRAEFRRHVSTLAVLYPRHHNRWQETWASALASLRGFRHHRAVAQDEWLRPALPSQCFPHIDHARNVPARRNWTRAARRPAHLPPTKELDAVVDAVDTTEALDDALWRLAHSLLNRHWAYARYTHHSRYAVRKTHNLCDRLLRKDPSESQLAEIHSWTLEALRAENGNPYIWDLWAKVLAVAGADETSLDVRWEAVRRFPDNLVTRMAMIVALAGNDRRELAEHLFNATSQDFPNEVIEPRLLQAHRWDEAASAMSTRGSHDPQAGEFRRVIEDEQYFNGTEDRYSSRSRLGPQTHVVESLRDRARLLAALLRATERRLGWPRNGRARSADIGA